ncbi:MAG: flagellar hook-length control protein FliK, partial [Acidimicrobiaceae bacterium]
STATPQAAEGVAPTEALQSLDVAPAASLTADAVQVNDITVQATPELVDNNDINPLIRLDAAAPTASTSQITPAASQSSASTDVDGLAQLVTSHAQKASQTGTSSRLSITLRPDDLGTVQLEIRAGANGLEIATATTHESGRAAIESVIPEIRAMAQQSGLRISEIQVGTTSSSDNLSDLQQHGDRRDNHQQPEQHRRTPEAANMTRTVNLTDGHIGQVNVEV